MKLAIAIISSSTIAAGAALSTLRVGPRKLNRVGEGFEFGRPVDVDDENAAFHEVKFAHMRFLHDSSFGKESGMSLPYPGTSLPYPGMSLPYPGMSLPYPCMSLPLSVMSLPYSGMSLPIRGMTPLPTTAPSSLPSSTPTATMPGEQPNAPSEPDNGNNCTPRDMTAKTTIKLTLDIDSLSSGSTFLESLTGMTDGIVSYGELHFSLCHQPGNRRLSEHETKLDQTGVAVTGLEAMVSPVGNVGESCTPATEGAYCTVVDLILTVYSGSNESALEAQVQVHDEIVEQLMAGEFLNDEIIAVRLHQDDEEDVPAGLSTNTGGSNETPQESFESSTSRTIAIAVLVTLAFLAMALIVFALYRKKRANKQDSNNGAGCGGEDESKCDSSTLSGDDITAQETMGNSV